MKKTTTKKAALPKAALSKKVAKHLTQYLEKLLIQGLDISKTGH